MKRVFLIVLDSLGAGQMPDAPVFGDRDCHTLKRIAGSKKFAFNSMKKMGMGNIDGQDFLPREEKPLAAVARVAELSCGKDSTIGHWEIAGVVSPAPLPTYPDGFPPEVTEEFTKLTGRGILLNKPYSGTDAIREYGREHMETGKLIVYTSADSVFQIAAHEDIVPVETLYEYCRLARNMLQGKHGVGRVIARPFVGTPEEGFTRTYNRRDFSLEAPEETVLDRLAAEGKTVYGIGKIEDLFAHRGLTKSIHTGSNTEGMAKALEALDLDFEGLCFVNLVDFDAKYGHRQDVDGYAAAFAEFDAWLPSFLAKMRDEDVLMITADHGCDPGDSHTDHTREYIPLLICGKPVKPLNLGTIEGFATIAATVADYLGSSYKCGSKSLLPIIAKPSKDEKALVKAALEAMEKSYSPYSGFKVGAALLAENGKIYSGCNIENAAYSPSVCAERTAVFKAVSEGVSSFKMLAVCGGKGGKVKGVFPPCGVCRQVIAEFCSPDMPVLLISGRNSFERTTFGALLPGAFSPSFMGKSDAGK